MSSRARTYICAQVRPLEDEAGAPVRLQEDEAVILLIDEGSLVIGEDYFLAARSAGEIQAGSMVAVWDVDTLVLPDWSGDEPLDRKLAQEWTRSSCPLRLLLRAGWDEFFQIPKGREYSVRSADSDGQNT